MRTSSDVAASELIQGQVFLLSCILVDQSVSRGYGGIGIVVSQRTETGGWDETVNTGIVVW